MNAKSLIILGIGTLGTAIVAILTLSKNEMLVQANQEKKSLFPNLTTSINDVDKVIVKRKDGEYTLERKGGEAQSWLVDRNIELKEKASDWLEKKILEVKRDRIRSVEVTQPEGELLAVDRAVPEQNDFTLVDVPEGKELIYPTAPGSLASGLEYVNLDDVEPAAKIDFAQAPGPTAKFKTFDGLVVTVQTKEQDGK